MSLSYALLALLTDCPSSGYELNRAFEKSIGCFWKASHQQIYRELGKLEELDWVNAELVPQQGKPDKKIYSITDLGRQELTVWITQPCTISPVKEEILVKLFVGNLVEPEVLRTHLKNHRQRYEERLALYRMIEAKGFSDVQRLSVEDHFRYLTLRCGIRDATSWIAWCDEVLEYLGTLGHG
ncbi:MAG: PadR family transcriptional regulator [Oscillatoriales cyanobacterium C42_A2020_001]|nr:PadR family transcriptional regulator [Leptolyngbyaceae cyanobacterium C42_A2020_001]